MKNTLLLSLFCLFTIALSAQNRIDGNFAFQSDPAKKYSVYVPSNYDEQVPNKLMLGLHPFNTSRWDAKSWCDTLIAFAEANDLLLICPDGGIDGQVDSPIDTAFTTALLDSTLSWYNVDTERIFAMGFSWGGRTTYTYGLNNADRFRGFMPIGAAMSGVNIDNIAANGKDKPFYFIHGSSDRPSTNMTPFKELLEQNGAITNLKTLSFVGHTIDFANRNAILTDAFRWLDTVKVGIILSTDNTNSDENSLISIQPNPVQSGQSFNLAWTPTKSGEYLIRLFDSKGILIQSTSRNYAAAVPTDYVFDSSGLSAGVYVVSMTLPSGELISGKVVVW